MGRSVYRALEGKPEGRKALGRPRPRWEGNASIEMDLDWTALAQVRDKLLLTQ